MPLADMLSEYWRTLQCDLFPWLEEDLGPLGEHHQRCGEGPHCAGELFGLAPGHGDGAAIRHLYVFAVSVAGAVA